MIHIGYRVAVFRSGVSRLRCENSSRRRCGQSATRPQQHDYDWLGDGIYFWEHNAQRAFDFAKSMRDRPHPSGQKIRTPAVIGAVIDLGYCLNLLDASHIALVRNAHSQFIRLFDGVDD